MKLDPVSDELPRRLLDRLIEPTLHHLGQSYEDMVALLPGKVDLLVDKRMANGPRIGILGGIRSLRNEFEQITRLWNAPPSTRYQRDKTTKDTGFRLTKCCQLPIGIEGLSAVETSEPLVLGEALPTKGGQIPRNLRKYAMSRHEAQDASIGDRQMTPMVSWRFQEAAVIDDGKSAKLNAQRGI
jgi:hypothetical protein